MPAHHCRSITRFVIRVCQWDTSIYLLCAVGWPRMRDFIIACQSCFALQCASPIFATVSSVTNMLQTCPSAISQLYVTVTIRLYLTKEVLKGGLAVTGACLQVLPVVKIRTLKKSHFEASFRIVNLSFDHYIYT